jgi:hypothetical protein
MKAGTLKYQSNRGQDISETAENMLPLETTKFIVQLMELLDCDLNFKSIKGSIVV